MSDDVALEAVELMTQMRAEIERLQGIVQFGETASRQQREGLQAELERLRVALKGRDAVCDSYAEENQRFFDEIERLKTALIHNSEWRDENIRVWAEVERLRAALRHVCAASSIADAVYAARAALEERK